MKVPAVGDVVVYVKDGKHTHSAIVIGVSGNLITQLRSKWGAWSEVLHQLREVPLVYGEPLYLLRRNAAAAGSETQNLWNPLMTATDDSGDLADDHVAADAVAATPDALSVTVDGEVVRQLLEPSLTTKVLLASSPAVARQIIAETEAVVLALEKGAEVESQLLSALAKPGVVANVGAASILFYALERVATRASLSELARLLETVPRCSFGYPELASAWLRASGVQLGSESPTQLARETARVWRESTRRMSQSASFPKVSIKTIASNTYLASGQTIDLSVTVEGDRRAQDAPVPTSLVFVLDCSGSMATSMNALKRATRELVNGLPWPSVEVALVRFGDRGRVVLPFTPDPAVARRAIDNLDAEGLTNMAEGLMRAAELLPSAAYPSRLVVLLSDGRPEPDSLEQEKRIRALFPRFGEGAASVHTIGLGNLADLLLRDIATATGGEFIKLSGVGELLDAFRRAYTRHTETLTIKSVSVTEEVHPGFQVVEGSLKIGYLPPSNDSTEFERDLDAVRQNFYQSGKIQFPLLYELSEARLFTYTFAVRARVCDPGRERTVDLRTRVAKVSFRNGLPAVQELPLTRVITRIEKCGVKFEKSFDEEARLVTLTVHNGYDQPLRNAVIRDSLYSQFTVDRIQEAEPIPTGVIRSGGDIYWELSRIDGKSSKSFLFYVADTQVGPQGSYQLQSQDWQSYWNVLVLGFTLSAGSREYLELLRNLRAGVISGPMEVLFAQRLGMLQRPAGGSAGPVPPEFAGEDFDWMVSFSSPPSGPSRYDSTGRFLVREGEQELEVVMEVTEGQIAPEYFTSPSYTPR